MKKGISFLLFFFLLNSVKGQDKCSPQFLYKTKYLGEGKDNSRLIFPLHFIITTDSLIVSIDINGKDQFLAFRIISKECFWNKDFSEGKSEYKLMLYDLRGNKYPTLNIIVDKKQPVYIELLYENAEKRVFTQL